MEIVRWKRIIWLSCVPFCVGNNNKCVSTDEETEIKYDNKLHVGRTTNPFVSGSTSSTFNYSHVRVCWWRRHPPTKLAQFILSTHFESRSIRISYFIVCFCELSQEKRVWLSGHCLGDKRGGIFSTGACCPDKRKHFIALAFFFFLLLINIRTH